jgi:2-polyprenyl-3-methyl-5-hydroxy-6-metoxy-1,4-benzoquinol methylase
LQFFIFDKNSHMQNERQQHWENIYETKQMNDVSWFQATPTTSLAIIEGLGLSADAAIIDVGGGDSFLVDNLLEHGFENISIVDISKRALERAQKRLGEERAAKITWLEGDIASFTPPAQYDCWHDRAAFHFLVEDSDIQHYAQMVAAHIKPDGYLVVATFAEDGPMKCSGLAIRQYSEDSLTELFSENFELVNSMAVTHITPFETEQRFIFVVMQKK